MKAGELRHKFTLQQPIETYGASGGVETDYADWATVWMGIKNQAGREFFAAQQVNAELTDLFFMRYREGVNSRMRLKKGDRTWEILAAIDIEERHKEIHLHVKERL